MNVHRLMGSQNTRKLKTVLKYIVLYQGSQLTCWPEAGSREKARILLLPHSPPNDHHSDDSSLKSPLTVPA